MTVGNRSHQARMPLLSRSLDRLSTRPPQSSSFHPSCLSGIHSLSFSYIFKLSFTSFSCHHLNLLKSFFLREKNKETKTLPSPLPLVATHLSFVPTTPLTLATSYWPLLSHRNWRSSLTVLHRHPVSSPQSCGSIWVPGNLPVTTWHMQFHK